ncbi:other/AgaK1 protein kinase [Coprinopsis cinerea AmutBmut pab1-1]|nr:other/AgaK1 protein kinase [Coprinopsis cinerea AmutBmut pab1-1]
MSRAKREVERRARLAEERLERLRLESLEKATSPGSISAISAELQPKLVADCQYHQSLSEFERLWVDRYTFLLRKGLRLRPRYRPGWSPSWLDNGKAYFACEDYLRTTVPHVLDAENIKDGSVVCIKMLLQRDSQEAQIVAFLSSERMLKEQWNHSGFLLDRFADPYPGTFEYLVMPLLRRFDDPEFGYVEEVIDFVTQVLEGLVFLHSHLIAHNDFTGANIMMDARPILPSGWHPASLGHIPDLSTKISPLSRIDNPVKYYIIDFGIAHRLQPGDAPIVRDCGGRDRDAPELKRSREYNPFKLDVFTAANTFYNELWKKYHRLDFLADIILYGMAEDPDKRPSAPMVLERWYQVEKDISTLTRHLRLQRKEETLGESLVKDAFAIALQAPAMLMGSLPKPRRRS